MSMKILNANLAAALKVTIGQIQLGLYNANLANALAMDPEATVAFSMEVVTEDGFNTITRTSTTTPAADEVSTDVTDAYDETTVRTPATTQTDDLNSTGGDTTTTDTTYTEFAT